MPANYKFEYTWIPANYNLPSGIYYYRFQNLEQSKKPITGRLIYRE
jgi:hypothetical protein